MFFGGQRVPSIQLVGILAAIAYFFTWGTGASAAYGGLISLVNTGLINRHISKQDSPLNVRPQTSVGTMMLSVVMRMGMVAVLILTGFLGLKLNADALMAGLVFGLMGFLMDKVLHK